MAYRLAAQEGAHEHHVQCCHMLGFCFKNKSMPKVAVMWFQRGLRIPNSTEDEYQALRFEIGNCYEEMGEVDKALDVFTEVYGVDVNYRRVGDKIKQLQATKNA
jgi:tetratricopeptide (TPR) repeat protein